MAACACMHAYVCVLGGVCVCVWVCMRVWVCTHVCAYVCVLDGEGDREYLLVLQQSSDSSIDGRVSDRLQ